MYDEFAKVYDHVMDNIPYDDWFCTIKEYLQKKGIKGGRLCELGCGTGTLTEMFAREGYEVIGVDNSEDMLAIAARKQQESKLDILYLNQDMSELQLDKPVDVVISLCDSINYLVQDEQLYSTMKRVKEYLKEGGYFIFDIKTQYCYTNIIGNQTWVEQDDEVSYIWENYFYDDQMINEYMLTVFKKDEDTGLYEKFEEAHYQRAYELDMLKKVVEDSGLEVVECFDESFSKEPTEQSERIYLVAKA